MKRFFKLLPALGLFLLLVFFSQTAAAGVKEALALCAQSLAPSLFPFFVLSRLLSLLGFTELLGQRFGPFLEKSLRISPAGAEAFVLGLSGGYPLGAVTLAQLRRDGRISKEEAERLLPFCNNSGPAFILGGAGAILGSARAGVLLYLAHVLSAITLALLCRTQASPPTFSAPPDPDRRFGEALTEAVAGALTATLNVCAYVCFFSSLLALADGFSFLPEVLRLPLTGFFELGRGVAGLQGLRPTPPVMALAGAMLFWGGVSVHLQTLGALAGTDIKSARHFGGRALGSVFAAAFSYLFGLLFL